MASIAILADIRNDVSEFGSNFGIKSAAFFKGENFDSTIHRCGMMILKDALRDYCREKKQCIMVNYPFFLVQAQRPMKGNVLERLPNLMKTHGFLIIPGQILPEDSLPVENDWSCLWLGSSYGSKLKTLKGQHRTCQRCGWTFSTWLGLWTRRQRNRARWFAGCWLLAYCNGVVDAFCSDFHSMFS